MTNELLQLRKYLTGIDCMEQENVVHAAGNNPDDLHARADAERSVVG